MAERQGVCQRLIERVARGILVNRHQRRHAHALGEQLAHAVPRRLGRDHCHVDILRRRDLLEMNIEAVREHQRLAGRQVRRDIFGVNVGLNMVRHQNHDNIGGLGGIGGFQNFQPGGFGFSPVRRAGNIAHHHVHAGITQIQCVRVALASVPDNGDRASLQEIQISVFFVITLRHFLSSSQKLINKLNRPLPMVAAPLRKATVLSEPRP